MRGEEEGKAGDKGYNEEAAAAVLVTQLATALVCSAQPCRGKHSSLAQLTRSAPLATNLLLLSR